MSDHSSSGNRPLIPGQIAAWLGVVSLVAAGLIVTGYSYLALRQGTSEDAFSARRSFWAWRRSASSLVP